MVWDITAINNNNNIFVTAKKDCKISDEHIESLIEILVSFNRRFHIVWGCHGKKDGTVYFW